MVGLARTAAATVLGVAKKATVVAGVGGVLTMGVVRAMESFTAPDAVRGSARNPRPLYKGHKPTSTPQKLMVAAGSALLSVSDPTNPDHIAALGDITSIPFLSRMRDIMLRDPEGRQILKERPLVQFTPSEYEGLGKKSPDSFGYAYYHSMRSQGISWETRTKVQYVDDEELAYMMTRHRQIHDFYHTLLGLKIKILDELTLKCFEFAQTGLPVGMLAGLFGSLRLPPDQKLAFYTVYAPWAVRSGAQARPLFNVFWEKHWDTPIVELRRQLNVSLPPDLS